MTINFPEFILSKKDKIQSYLDKLSYSKLTYQEVATCLIKIEKILDNTKVLYYDILILSLLTLIRSILSEECGNKDTYSLAIRYFIKDDDLITDGKAYGLLDDLLINCLSLSGERKKEIQLVNFKENSIEIKKELFLKSLPFDEETTDVSLTKLFLLYNKVSKKYFERLGYRLNIFETKSDFPSNQQTFISFAKESLQKIFEIYSMEITNTIFDDTKSIEDKVKSILSLLWIISYLSADYFHDKQDFLFFRQGLQLGIESKEKITIVSGRLTQSQKESLFLGYILFSHLSDLKKLNEKLRKKQLSDIFNMGNRILHSKDYSYKQCKVIKDNGKYFLETYVGENDKKKEKGRKLTFNDEEQFKKQFFESYSYLLIQRDFKNSSSIPFICYLIYLLTNNGYNPLCANTLYYARQQASQKWDIINSLIPSRIQMKIGKQSITNYLGKFGVLISDTDMYGLKINDEESLASLIDDINKSKERFAENHILYYIDKLNFKNIKSRVKISEKFTLVDISKESFSMNIKERIIPLNPNTSIAINFVSSLSKNIDPDIQKFFNFFSYKYLHSFESKTSFDEDTLILDGVENSEEILYFENFYKEDGERDLFLKSFKAILQELHPENTTIVCTKRAIMELRGIFPEWEFLGLYSILNSTRNFYKDYDNLVIVGMFSKKINILKQRLKYKKLYHIFFAQSEIKEEVNDFWQNENLPMEEIANSEDYETVNIGNSTIEVVKHSRMLLKLKNGKHVLKSKDWLMANENKISGLYRFNQFNSDIDRILNFFIAERDRHHLALNIKWKSDLRKYFDINYSVKSLSLKDFTEDLQKNGIDRTRVTTKEWLFGEYTVLPRSTFRDLKLIYKHINEPYPFSKDQENAIHEMSRYKNKLTRILKACIMKEFSLLQKKNSSDQQDIERMRNICETAYFEEINYND